MIRSQFRLWPSADFGVGDRPIVGRFALIQVNADRRVAIMVSASGGKPQHGCALQPSRSQIRRLRSFGWVFAGKNTTGVKAALPTFVDKAGRTKK
jgi:hypothetical protein